MNVKDLIYTTMLPFFNNNEYAVFGLMANIQCESDYNPKNMENGYEKKIGMDDEAYTAAVDEGTYHGFEKDSVGYGLVQWTWWTRKRGLLGFAKERYVSIGDVNMQIEFIKWELQHDYIGTYTLLKRAKSAGEAARLVMLHYEQPANQTEENQLRRARIAEELFQSYSVTENQSLRKHTVQKGDTLYSLARRYQTTVNRIVDSNISRYPTIRPDFIRIGWQLSILPNTTGTHRVEKGETLWKLSKMYNTTITEIVETNKGLYPTIRPDYIEVGWELIIG